jgi:hypothetical protein
MTPGVNPVLAANMGLIDSFIHLSLVDSMLPGAKLANGLDFSSNDSPWNWVMELPHGKKWRGHFALPKFRTRPKPITSFRISFR